VCRRLLIIEGSVKIFRTSPGGRELMRAIEIAPSSVADLPLFNEGHIPLLFGLLVRLFRCSSTRTTFNRYAGKTQTLR
jgi:hypothetical protein